MAAGARQQTSELCSGREIADGLCLERPLGTHRKVWLARDEAARFWAVKTAAPAMIEHEARVLSALSHPHIVRLQALVRGESGPLLVLEYLAGGDLVSLAGAAPIHWLAALAAVVDALEYLHGQGIVHRDLKARNVLFDSENRARLIDFGSALSEGSPWTAGGTTIVAPDRGGTPVSAADDVYALAALVHELLYGAPPGRDGRTQPAAADLPLAATPQAATPVAAAVLQPAATPLAAAVDACLASYSSAARLGLESFRTVIESLRERSLSQS